MKENELFSLDEFSAPVPSTKKKKYSGFKTDPAWDDGSAFPSTSQQNLQVIAMTSSLAEIDDNSNSEDDDRWNPLHFSPVNKHEVERNGQITIFFDCTEEPPDPDDYKTLGEYETAWALWEKRESLKHSTSTEVAEESTTKEKVKCNHSECFQAVAELGQVLTTLLPCSDCSTPNLLNGTTSANQCSNSDTLECPSTEILELSTHSQTNTISVVSVHHVNPLASEASDLPQVTVETASPTFLESLRSHYQATALSRTCPDSLHVRTHLVSNGSTSITFVKSLPDLGTNWKALSFPVHQLEVPTRENGLCSLPSPTAYSSAKSRPPGINKLENFLRKKGLIQATDVMNPKFLEETLGLPSGWTDPQNTQTVWEFLKETQQQEVAEWHSVTHLIQDWLILRFPAFFTWITCVLDIRGQFLEEMDDDIPEIRVAGLSDFDYSKELESQEKEFSSKKKGCLYKYLENKKLKDGRIVNYPRVEGERDPDNDKHWRWGFNWEEKVNEEWKNRSIGCVPIRVLSMIKAMQKMNTPITDIVRFIRQSKNTSTP